MSLYGPIFYSNDPAIAVELTAKRPVADIVVRLEPKAGMVSGMISDAVTGKPVAGRLRLFLWGQADEGPTALWLQRDDVVGHYEILVPSRMGVAFSVRAPGYEVWHSQQEIRLDPGSDLTLDIILQPSHNGNAR
jgi:hypothetical protein